MRKEAIIHVMATQGYDHKTEDQMEFTTTGAFYSKGGAFYALYRESQITGMDGVSTSLKIKADKVILNRMGMADYRQTFEVGVLHHATYVTAMGSFHLSVYTETLDVCLTESGGHITLKYDLFADNQFVSKNALRIGIKEDAPR